ncbi:MAG: SdpI family protein [Candidatus Methanoperedens sp.]|nr:SdpI family protein [Candidatus Methanoperedens sp.]
MRKSEIVIIGIVLLSFGIGIYVYPEMPEKIASHWNAQGEVDGYMSKFWGIFLMPIISVGLFLLFVIIPGIDPYKSNIEKFRKYYDNFIIVIILFLFYIYLLTIFWNMGFRYNMITLLSPAFAILFYYSGVLIENAKMNWFIGIRTPWTLSSEKVWDKTHKIGGKLFKIAGIIAFAGILFQSYAIFFILVPILSAVIYLVIFSYIEYQKETK